MPQYGEASYWNQRYQQSNGETFDWLEDYATLEGYIISNVEGIENPKILNLGCGNSILCEYLYDDGFTNIVNIDISEIVIDQMRERNKHRPNMVFKVMDALDLQFEDDSFDLIIDKSTIDAILCGNHSYSSTAKMLKEVYRVLKNNGIYMMISYGDPNSRVWHLKREFLEFDVQIRKIEKEIQLIEEEQFRTQSLIHYVYNCRKVMTKPKQYYIQRFESIVKEIELEELEQLKEEANEELLDELIKEYIDADNEEDFSQFIEKVRPQQTYQQLLQDLGYL